MNYILLSHLRSNSFFVIAFAFKTNFQLFFILSYYNLYAMYPVSFFKSFTSITIDKIIIGLTYPYDA